MFQIEKNIERKKNLYKKTQKNPSCFSKTAMLAMVLLLNASFVNASFANVDHGNPVTSNPQSVTTDGLTSTISAQQPSNRMHPHELILYYDGKNGGHINPKSLFSVCTISGGDPNKFKGLNYGKDRRIGLLNQAKNSKFPLHWFSMKKWQQLYQASPSSINDDVVLSLSNQGEVPLSVTLPDFISMRLFIFGNVVIENNARIENGSTIIGVDPRRMNILSSGCPFYADHIVPSTVRIKGQLKGGVLVIGSDIILEKGLPNWVLLNASVNVLDGQGEKNDEPFGIFCCGRTNIVFAKTTRINGDVVLSSDDYPLRTDPSDRANNGVASFDNVIFAPKTLGITLPSVPKKGFFTIKGQVILHDTELQIEWRLDDVQTDQNQRQGNLFGRRILIIKSDRPIVGKPHMKLPVCLLSDASNMQARNIRARCDIQGNNVYVVLTKVEGPSKKV